jgi:hypothetical protein
MTLRVFCAWLVVAQLACSAPTQTPSLEAARLSQVVAAGAAASRPILPPPSAALVLAAGQTLVPHASWTCGMPDGIPDPLTGQFLFDIDFELGVSHDLGDTPLGQRVARVVDAGTVYGERVRGLLASRGLELELLLADGTLELEQIHVLTLGEEQVFMHNCGIAVAADEVARVVLDFEASTSGAYAFLNEGRYVGLREYDPVLGSLRLKVYDMAAAAPPSAAPAVQFTKPAGVPTQSWACVQGAANSGSEVFSERVIMAQSLAVGDSKRGSRNIMTIADGMLSGQLSGRVLSGGADYQLFGADGSIEIDARYVLETSDGELILVRNCGRYGAWLTPTFETRSAGAYAWLNDGQYASSDPAPDLASELLTVDIVISEGE